MTRLYLLSALLPIFAKALAIGATNQAAGATQNEANLVEGAFIVECNSLSDVKSLKQEIQSLGGTVRHNYTSDTFFGLSAQLPGGSDGKASNFSSEMKTKSGVKNVWPVETVTLPTEATEEIKEVQEKLQRRGSRRATDGKAPWNHLMTQVDKLHAEGYSGKGIKVGVVDTGALGGCFGPNCRVAFGGYFDGNTVQPEPIVTHSYGTIVASILAGYSEEDGFVGAAPNATIGAYSIGGGATHAEDSIIAAWLQAEKDGMQVIVSSFGYQGGNWAQRPTAMVVSRLVAKGIPCVVGIGNEKSNGLFNVMNPSSGRGVISVNSFTEQGYIASLSASGPTAELDIKPQVGAPGEQVPVAYADGSYGKNSGTSFAGPLVAGIIALVAEARGTFDPALIESLLVSTAEPRGEPNYSVALQGGGLIQAWDAAHATTLVQPASLAFNDTDHRVPKLSLKITNTAKSDVKYQLSSIASDSIYTLGDWGIKQDETIQSSAQIKLSQSSFTLTPGQSTSVDVSASDPEGADPNRLPVWSGYIKIQETGSSSKALTVPYLGVAGSLRSMRVIPFAGHVSVRNWDRPAKMRYNKIGDTPVVVADPPSMGKEGLGRIENFQWPADTIHNNPVAIFDIKVGTPRIEVHVVPLDICPKQTDEKLSIGKACVPESSLVDVAGIKSIGVIADYEHNYKGRGDEENVFVFKGLLESGEYAPPGRYKFVARALALFGDADNEAHWQVQETHKFTFGYESNLIEVA
ncbi:Peptidase S8, subtilisin-related protein [Cordyceps fumosorosea ARSEF 2679]|uniref:Peptidase S8, subtilisin-related protein n=1 Tax=Cordyceps fumosorosea (strain ARSEF 2679) TaxID=1081104 RepID=A0A162LJ73_CORFA|nr:Peptidase S8, subtilisin-related protein [Cordyceps fumosorosea ARSEF 2679]OAA71274.1 Peptidase S8, subtilisin-related protein [Cordyceps fumosorosea ARSEF 2679]